MLEDWIKLIEELFFILIFCVEIINKLDGKYWVEFIREGEVFFFGKEFMILVDIEVISFL